MKNIEMQEIVKNEIINRKSTSSSQFNNDGDSGIKLSIQLGMMDENMAIKDVDYANIVLFDADCMDNILKKHYGVLPNRKKLISQNDNSPENINEVLTNALNE